MSNYSFKAVICRQGQNTQNIDLLKSFCFSLQIILSWFLSQERLVCLSTDINSALCFSFYKQRNKLVLADISCLFLLRPESLFLNLQSRVTVHLKAQVFSLAA